MNAELQDFYSEYFHSIVSDSNFNFCDTAFVENMTEFLEDQGYLEECSYIGFSKKVQGIKADAWDFNKENGVLTLLIADFRFSTEIQTITETEVDKNFKRLEKFWTYSKRKDFIEALEESTPAYSLIYQLTKGELKVKRLRMILITNALLSSRISDSVLNKRISPDSAISTSYEIWDLERLYAIKTSEKAREDLIIDCTEVAPEGISCLQAKPAECGDYQVFLLIVPGDFLANLYDRYNERLLEQNVRTFLQFRGNINKGIKATILREPHMFIAYNNGLTVTAEKVTLSADNTHLLSVTNLQIVNGGQTTASLFTTRSQEGKDKLKNVFVQVKLTVIPEEKVEEIVPKISEYANTQNKVNAADFFSNHPFHLRIQEFSRRMVANPATGNLRGSFWYYERTKGQYNNAMARMSKTEIAGFKTDNPKNQMFTKTDLSKFIYSWDKKPTIVSLGAQKCFAQFAKEMGSTWVQNDTIYNELYFKELIAKAIIFRYLDTEIKNQSWYGGFKANIVTYTIAKFKDYLDSQKLVFNLQKIWDQQDIPTEIKKYLLDIAQEINLSIQDTPNPATNVTEWCKNTMCWDKITELDIKPDFELEKFCIWQEYQRADEHDAVATQKMLNGIDKQKYVIQVGCDYWKTFAQWIINNKQDISEKEANILKLATQFDRSGRIPSEKQCIVLLQLETRMKQEGFFFEQA